MPKISIVYPNFSPMGKIYIFDHFHTLQYNCGKITVIKHIKEVYLTFTSFRNISNDSMTKSDL